uniref:Cytoskeleton protein RodZ n=1 Tax=Candidatus Kentrum eta TaxID=2126337 RepID=A0A450UJM4_9GAMM|nr:MAG: cytoskeleton protein RodZ [Candidatus Kentron sp. H]VFJ92741.1 MAG: cytoskeleton protein RodZ [Candidatus Kentron sp. H]VFJ97611.1 MAG: cytoskeleton protein RodZ [Candidatus Kentron sp. H]
MTVPQSNSPVSAPATPEEEKGPGKQLKEARQLRNLTINNIAVRLRLDPATIYHLEEEDYDKLPEPAFIRGYLRAYARSLGIEPEPVLSSFESYDLTPPPLVRDFANRPQIRSNHIVVRLTTYLIVFCLTALTFDWWQDQTSLDGDVVKGEIIARRNQGASSNEASSNPEPSPRKETKIASNRPTRPPSNQPPATEGVLTGMRANRELSDTFRRESGAIDATASPGAENPPITPVPVGDVRDTKPVMPGKSGTPKIDHLALYLRDDCWMEIHDGSGKKVYYQIGFANKTYQFQGIGPFHVALGHARGVKKIVYNGKPFDHAQYIQREFAEFSLGNLE